MQKWITDHHKNPTTPQFINENNKLASTDKENIDILLKHFNKIYNSVTQVDFSILDDIK